MGYAFWGKKKWRMSYEEIIEIYPVKMREKYSVVNGLTVKAQNSKIYISFCLEGFVECMEEIKKRSPKLVKFDLGNTVKGWTELK